MLWRAAIGADKILETYEEIAVIEKYRTGGILGHDKNGCPIYIDPYGLIDMKGWSVFVHNFCFSSHYSLEGFYQ